MAFGNNPFDVLREEDEEDDATYGAERAGSPEKPMSATRQIVAHWRRKSSTATRPSNMVSPSGVLGDAAASSATRPLSWTLVSKAADTSIRRKSIPSQRMDDTDRRKSIPAYPMDNDNRRKSITAQPIDESRIYIRGVQAEAMICKAHFTSWRRNLHRGCEDKDCTLHHDPRDWPVWVVEMISSGPMKELLEVQQDIDIVIGKGEFNVDTALARLKPSVISPPRARSQKQDTKKTMLEVEQLNPEELAAKGRRIQKIWNEALRLYRLRKENPEEAHTVVQHAPAQNRPRPYPFFGDDDAEDQLSSQY